MQFHIENMTCGACVRRVTAAVHSIDPAAQVTADVGEHRVQVQSAGTQEQLMAVLDEAGYPARPVG
ncbi:heavy metal transport/detoxification protein [Advenella sp. S44]|uniref:heavy-metal-associated domain-containing protein n=1 Tax=Advenella sp. S44 TaxID=1982755 RepID=UPI000C2A975C|nr:heavy-metal-associated domain-containing protein [Advenella sp. S44]PJX20534.1 heavy metal transport/detoxification protein [Advenella sp. S44]